MLTYPVDPSYTLIELADLEQDPVTEPIRAHEAPLRTVVAWARDYLCQPHAELGRSGNVCPYAHSSIDRGMLYLTVQPGADPDLALIAARLCVYRDWFQDLSRQAGSAKIFGAILMLLPDLPCARVSAVVDRLQEELKSEYVGHGLMIGEFHSGPPNKAGLWNPDFRPLRSPVPMLAIRHMVPTDYLFLESEPSHVAAYLRLFGNQVPTHLRERISGYAS